MKINKRTFLILIAFLMIVSACSLIPGNETNTNQSSDAAETEEIAHDADEPECPACPTLAPAEAEALSGTGTVMLTGMVEYTNDFYPEGYAREHAVALLDMTGFVLRDTEWVIPVESQVLGYLDMDPDSNSGTYTLQLPILPAGQMNDVDQDGEAEQGVQIFAVEYSPNWTGGPFYADDDMFLGWPSYLASITVDRENQDEVNGGKLIVFAPDSNQDFPTGFGEDGMLFTEDDPTAPLEAGYSVVDLDTDPFTVTREPIEEVILYEPTDAAVKDFSDQSYTEAFNNMFDIVSKEYAFNGWEAKAPDWDAVYAEIYPMVEEAEDNNNPYAYYLALREFTFKFRDGHVGLSGGDYTMQYNTENITGGYGIAIRELDDGTVIVVYVVPGSIAETFEIEVGAEIISVDGLPVSEALSQVEAFSPQSTDFGLRYEQTIFLFRGPVGVEKEFVFANPGQEPETVMYTSTIEMDSLYYTYYDGALLDIGREYLLPVEYELLPEGVGYIRLNSNSDDLNLAYRIVERALQSFEEFGTLGVIFDLRFNFGGAPLGIAGYLTDEEIPLGQLEYYSDLTGQFEAEGSEDKFTPFMNQYDVGDMVLLVDQFCYSACEIEAYGLSQVPGMTVMGQFPTAGVEAETARGDFELPAGISLTVPTGRFVLEDGSIFLEGQGVIPDIDIPVDEEHVLSDEDLVLEEAIDYIMNN